MKEQTQKETPKKEKMMSPDDWGRKAGLSPAKISGVKASAGWSVDTKITKVQFDRAASWLKNPFGWRK